MTATGRRETRSTASPETPGDLGSHAGLMDAVYSHTRHIYDATRKYYLVCRDRMIRSLDLAPGGSVCEIGCGTGRNLIQTARRYPNTHLFGIDASRQMLKTAEANAGKTPYDIRFAHGFAETVNLSAFECAPSAGFDVVMFPYSLSMIPDWQGALANAGTLLADGGRLHVVDFGTMDRWPAFARRPFQAFLAQFHVEPRTNVSDALAAQPGLTSVSEVQLMGGYAQLHEAKRIA